MATTYIMPTVYQEHFFISHIFTYLFNLKQPMRYGTLQDNRGSVICSRSSSCEGKDLKASSLTL